jgi:hypothetical protein
VLVIAAALASTVGIGSARAAATCTETGLVRDGINLTAAVFNPTTTVTGTVDATGCNIGVYYGPGTTGSVDVAEIFGATYYGVVVNAAAVDVTGSSIHGIGEVPFNGSQHGVGVLYTTVDQAGNVTGRSATGTLSETRSPITRRTALSSAGPVQP